jgi:hypothetical protein
MASILYAWTLFLIVIVLLGCALKLRGAVLNARGADPLGARFRIRNTLLSFAQSVLLLGTGPLSWYLVSAAWPRQPPTIGPLRDLGPFAWPVLWFVLAIELPSALAFMFAWWGEYRWVKRSAPRDPRRERAWTALLMALLGGMISSSGILLIPSAPDVFDTLAVLNILASTALLLSIAVRLSPGRSAPSASASEEFLLTRLGSALDDVTRAFRVPAKPWTMTTIRKRRELSRDRQRAAGFAIWWQKFRLGRPTIPEQMVRELTYESVVALTALHYARKSTPIANRPLAWINPRRCVRAGLSLVFGILFSFTFTSTIFISLLPSMAHLIFLVVCTIALSAAVLIRLVRPSVAVYHHAYDVWRQVLQVSRSGESAARFAFGLIQIDVCLQYELTREQTRRLVLSNRTLARFMAKADPEAMGLFQAMLDDWIDEGRRHDPAGGTDDREVARPSETRTPADVTPAGDG